MNKYDSETVASQLVKAGYQLIDDWKKADLLLVNTCSVRQHAEDRVYSRLGVWLKFKREKKPHLLIGVMGCMAQKEGGNLFKRFPDLDMVIGTYHLYQIVELIKEKTKEGKVLKTEEIEEGEPPFPCIEVRENPVSAFVSIMRGCNNFCSYCIVPYVRGRERSRSPESIEEEIEYLAEKGVKEITLLGQNVNSYRGFSSLHNKYLDFPDLLEEVNKIKGILRIRFTTSHPKDLSLKLIKKIKELKKVCEHIHLPIQSGSDKILKLMNRGYRVKDYLSLVEKIRENIPGVSITTDIIVGFPYEEEEDFLKTLKVMEEVKFDAAYIFKYSPRPLTRAYSFPDTVSKEEKERRLHLLLTLQKEISTRINEKFVGKSVEVLVEKKESQNWFGKTKEHKSVILRGGDNLLGKLVKVKIFSNRKGILEGEVEKIPTLSL